MKKNFIILAALLAFGVVNAQSRKFSMNFSLEEEKSILIDTSKNFSAIKLLQGDSSFFNFSEKNCLGPSFKVAVLEKAKKVLKPKKVVVYSIKATPGTYSAMSYICRASGLKPSSPEEIVQRLFYFSQDSALQNSILKSWIEAKNYSARHYVFVGYLKDDSYIYTYYDDRSEKWYINVYKETVSGNLVAGYSVYCILVDDKHSFF